MVISWMFFTFHLRLPVIYGKECVTTTKVHILEIKETHNPLNEDQWQAVKGYRTTGLLF
jgi:hypothetical protein